MTWQEIVAMVILAILVILHLPTTRILILLLTVSWKLSTMHFISGYQ